MKVYISMDGEGVTGIYKLSQVMSSDKEYDFARRMMANDINAAVEGAYNGGAIEVIVNDAHNYGDNLLIDQLDSRVKLISGSDKPLTMAQGAERCADVALLIGYHRRKGAKGVISHSYAYGSMVEIKINGKLASEHDLVGMVIGYFGTPVIFLSGDDLVTKDIRESIPGIYTVVTKECIGNGSAMCYHPKETYKMISKTVEEALKNYKNKGIKPMNAGDEVNIDVRYSAQSQARLAMGAPNSTRLSENEVRFSSNDYLEAYKSFTVGATLAGGFRDDAALYR